jgi:hypothetical protein
MRAFPWHNPPMALKRIHRPRDPVQLAKLIGEIATGQVVDAVDDGKDDAAVTRGKIGGKLGGVARAQSLSPSRRTAIAKQAAAKRWAKPES